jgi:polyisoprenoid-binding protein YceI
MKNILILVILLVLVGGFIKLGQKEDAEIKENTNIEESLDDTVGEFSLTSVPDGTYMADISESVLNWEGKKKILVNWIDRGTIKLQKAEGTVEGGKIINAIFTIDMSTISALSTGKGSGQDGLSKHLKSEDFFDVAKFPTSTFKVSSIDFVNNEIMVTGDLTIKSVTNQIKFPVMIESSGENYIARGKVEIDRTVWDIRYGSDKFFDNLGDNVINDIFIVEFNVVGKKS